MATRHLRIQVAIHRRRRAAIGYDHPVDVLIEDTLPIQLNAGNHDSLLEYVGRIGTVGSLRTNIYQMAFMGSIADQFSALSKDGHENRNIWRMRSGAVGDVKNNHTPRR